MYKSTDGGSHWASAGLSGKKVWALAVDPADPQLVYAATDQSGEVRMSANGGGSWTDIGLPGVTIYSLAVPTTAPELLYAGTSNGVYQRSGGAWKQLGVAGRAIAALSIDPQAARWIYAGSTDGAFVSFDGGATWKASPVELAGYTVQSISPDPFDPELAYFCTTLHGVLRAHIY